MDQTLQYLTHQDRIHSWQVWSGCLGEKCWDVHWTNGKSTNVPDFPCKCHTVWHASKRNVSPSNVCPSWSKRGRNCQCCLPQQNFRKMGKISRCPKRFGHEHVSCAKWTFPSPEIDRKSCNGTSFCTLCLRLLLCRYLMKMNQLKDPSWLLYFFLKFNKKQFLDAFLAKVAIY